RFAKWRAVINMGDGIPSVGAIEANAHALARYAALCQEAGLVPIVEPEVMMTGTHSLAKCLKVTTEVLHTVFEQLYKQHVLLEGMILKPNMILPGLDAIHQEPIATIAETTVACFLKAVPATVPGIAFLSGGQSPAQATSHLAAMNKMYASEIPWHLSFSFGRALQQPALEIWNGDDANIGAAQQALYLKAVLNRAACMGQYSSSTV
nr:fructose-bisphosphate aldolase class I [Pseudopedobacter sp.]